MSFGQLALRGELSLQSPLPPPRSCGRHGYQTGVGRSPGGHGESRMEYRDSEDVRKKSIELRAENTP